MRNVTICLKGGRYLDEDFELKEGAVLIEDGKIISVGEDKMENQNNQFIDVSDKIIIPGLIDIHFHGAVGSDFMYAKPEEIQKISKYLGENGTTAYLATTITSSEEELEEAAANIKEASEGIREGAAIEGIHVEGPYISPDKKGCHEAKLMRAPQEKEYDELKRIAAPLKLHFTVAPEVENVMDFIKYVSAKGDTLSIGHTNADSKVVNRALELGAASFTHLFNAMKGINHREPGVAGAALLCDAYTELICDGIHVNTGIMKLIYRLKGKDKIILITDAMKAAGLGDGDFMFGGFKVCVRNGIARKEDGTLASSTLTMRNAVRNMMDFVGVPFTEAVQMATLNPAKLLGLDNKIGSIAAGKRADILVVDDHMNVDMVFCKGIRVK